MPSRQLTCSSFHLSGLGLYEPTRAGITGGAKYSYIALPSVAAQQLLRCILFTSPPPLLPGKPGSRLCASGASAMPSSSGGTGGEAYDALVSLLQV